jgi:hypothetical protein
MLAFIPKTFGRDILILLALAAVGMSLSSFLKTIKSQQPLEGAFQQSRDDGSQMLILLKDGYFMLTSYSVEGRHFHYSWGGPFEVNGNTLKVLVDYNTYQPESVGQEVESQLTINKQGLDFNNSLFKRVDDGHGGLAGYWRIAKREQNGTMQEMPLQPRRTIKLLTSSRFQWAAINTETGAFFGTGGGTYSFSSGKYTENIEFFSRDSSRVGSSLTFEDNLEDSLWDHRGKSSKGEAIHEIWSREHPSKGL